MVGHRQAGGEVGSREGDHPVSGMCGTKVFVVVPSEKCSMLLTLISWMPTLWVVVQ